MGLSSPIQSFVSSALPLLFVFPTLLTYRRMALLLSPRQPNTSLDSVQHTLHLSCASHDISTERYLNNAKKSRTIWCHSHEAGVRGYWFCNLILITLSAFHPYQPRISAPHLKQLPLVSGSFTKNCLFPLAPSFLQLWQDPLNMELNIMNIISNGSSLRPLPEKQRYPKKNTNPESLL